MEILRTGRLLVWSMLAGAALLPAQAEATSGELALNPRGLGLSEAAAAELERAIAAEDWRLAESSLFAAVRGNPASAGLRRALGIAHYQAGRHFLAAAELKRADAIETLDEGTRHLLASAYLRIGRRHWARAELGRLIERQPESPSYRYSLARILYEQQRFGAATSELRSALRADPEFAEAHDLLGQCLEGLGRTEEAATAYRRAIDLFKTGHAPSPWPLYHLGSLLHDLGQMEGARAALEQAVKVDAGHVPSLRELGGVLLKSGRLDDSAKALETAARLEPDSEVIQYSLMRVYRLMGRTDLAANALRRYQEISNRVGQ